jgi:hypothetical protein
MFVGLTHLVTSALVVAGCVLIDAHGGRRPAVPANGISDAYALGVLAEAIGLPMPVVVLPFVITPLASGKPFQRSVSRSRVRVTVRLQTDR